MTLPRKIHLLHTAEAQIKSVFTPHLAGQVNDAQIKVAKFGEIFDWHAHAEEDEAFFVLKGRIAIDFRDGTQELNEGELIVVPRTVEHRPRALTHEPIVALFEAASTVNTGDADSALTVTHLERLK